MKHIKKQITDQRNRLLRSLGNPRVNSVAVNQKINYLIHAELKFANEEDCITPKINKLSIILNSIAKDPGSIKVNDIESLLNNWSQLGTKIGKRMANKLKPYLDSILYSLGSITDRGVKNLAGATVVSLAGNDAITDNSLYALGKGAEDALGAGAKKLDLRGCDEITDIGIEWYLAQTVEVIYLSNNENITGKGISSLKKLKNLYLYKCPNITGKDLMQISTSLNYLQLLLEDPSILGKNNRDFLNNQGILNEYFENDDIILAMWPFEGLD